MLMNFAAKNKCLLINCIYLAFSIYKGRPSRLTGWAIFILFYSLQVLKYFIAKKKHILIFSVHVSDDNELHSFIHFFILDHY